MLLESDSLAGSYTLFLLGFQESQRRGRERRFLTAHLHHVGCCVLACSKILLIATAAFQKDETFKGFPRYVSPY